MTNNTKPQFEKRLGQVRVAVWENETNGRIRHNVAVTRSYKQGDEWKETSTFGGEADLILLVEAVAAARQWIGQRPTNGGALPASNGDANAEDSPY